MLLAGEGPWSELGSAQSVDGQRVLLGAPHSRAAGASNGAAYVFELP